MTLLYQFVFYLFGLIAVASACVFTTHTPVAAGHDAFNHDLLLFHFSDFIKELGLPVERFLELAARLKSGAMSMVKVGIAPGLAEVINRIRVHLLERQPELSIEGLDIVSGRQYDVLRHGLIDIGLLRHVDDHPAVESDSWSSSTSATRLPDGSRCA